MPMNRLIVILVAVAALAGLTVWVGARVIAATGLPEEAMSALLIPLALIAFVASRVVSSRMRGARGPGKTDDRR